jgi:hypothetical protein
MNKEKEALLREIMAEPDVPRKVSMKNLLGFIDRMQPETQAMRDYLMAFFSAETQAESADIREAWCAKMSSSERQAFSDAYYRCCMNELRSFNKKEKSNVEELELAA